MDESTMRVLNTLKEREKMVIIERLKGRTLRDIGAQSEVTGQCILVIQNRALKKLSHRIRIGRIPLGPLRDWIKNGIPPRKQRLFLQSAKNSLDNV